MGTFCAETRRERVVVMTLSRCSRANVVECKHSGERSGVDDESRREDTKRACRTSLLTSTRRDSFRLTPTTLHSSLSRSTTELKRTLAPHRSF